MPTQFCLAGYPPGVESFRALMISILFNKFNIDSEDAKAKFGADHKSLGPTTPQALKKRCHGT